MMSDEKRNLAEQINDAKISLMISHSPDAWSLFMRGQVAPIPTEENLQQVAERMDERFRSWSGGKSLLSTLNKEE